MTTRENNVLNKPLIPLSHLQHLYLWLCERLYAELAWGYDWVSWFVSAGSWAVWQKVSLDYIRGKQILEIGFGTGTLLATLAQAGYTVTGLELSAAMHRQTTQKLARFGLTVPRVQAPTQSMPFADGAFDTIISTFPSGYIFAPATLAECARVLRRPTTGVAGGRLIIIMGISHSHTPWQLILNLLSWFYANASHSTQPVTDVQPLKSQQVHFAAAGLTATHLTQKQTNANLEIILAEHSAAN